MQYLEHSYTKSDSDDQKLKFNLASCNLSGNRRAPWFSSCQGSHYQCVVWPRKLLSPHLPHLRNSDHCSPSYLSAGRILNLPFPLLLSFLQSANPGLWFLEWLPALRVSHNFLRPPPLSNPSSFLAWAIIPASNWSPAAFLSPAFLDTIRGTAHRPNPACRLLLCGLYADLLV